MKINAFGNNEYSVENYVDMVKAQSKNSIENLKDEALQASYMVKYYGRNPSEYFQNLLDSIADLPYEEDMHDECRASDLEELDSRITELEGILATKNANFHKALNLLENLDYELDKGKLTETTHKALIKFLKDYL